MDADASSDDVVSCLVLTFNTSTLGLCIPANNTIFIVGISSSLANKEPHLTLEVCTGLLHLKLIKIFT